MNNNYWCNRVCPICGKDYYNDKGNLCVCYNCQNTLNIVLSKKEELSQDFLYKALTYILYHNPQKMPYFFGSDNEYNEIKQLDRDIIQILPEQVESWYPRTFAQKIDYILLLLYKKSRFVGDILALSWSELYRYFFVYINENKENRNEELKSQLEYTFNYLRQERYIKDVAVCEDEIKSMVNDYSQNKVYEVFYLTSKALARVDELQKDISNNKDVFVAMSFHNTEDIREAIRRGILEAGFSDKFIDEIIHNQQIVPYMMRLIRECRFLIMDITDPNYGAYYEAGYALGLGKEVIITCSKEIFSKKDFANKLEEKALKPHFDIAQKQILVWEDTADLTKQLKEWILELSTRKR